MCDGDWYRSQQAIEPTTEIGNLIKDAINTDDMIRGITVAIATKANYWSMNHHTGQGAVAGYVKKVLDIFYTGNVSDQVVSAAHSLGHFTSTLHILSKVGLRNIRESRSFIISNGARVKFSDDAKLRFSAMPAGTHRLAIAYESAKRLVRSVYAMYCPGIHEFANIPEMRRKVIEVQPNTILVHRT